MDKESLQPLSGFRDQLEPPKSAILDDLKKTFQRYGYIELETPVLERQEILMGKMGAEAQKLLYLFEDNGKRQVGLRYDLTVPLSRFVASNYQQLTLPFKRFEIGPVFRAEKPQKGRYRQFTQADIDIVGSDAGEKELLEVVSAAAKQWQIKLTVLVNDRRIVSAILDHLKIAPDSQVGLLRLLDKKDKISSDRLSKELGDLGLAAAQKKAVTGLFLAADEPLENVRTLLGSSPELNGIAELVKYGQSLGLGMKFDLAMVRGLDYYTGTIFEATADTYAGGSVMAGGRYDGLVESLIGQKVPAVGISFGLDRLADVVPSSAEPVLFIVALPSTELETRRWANQLRDQGRKVEVYLDSTVELGRQIKYAAKRGYKSVVIPLEEAWKQGMVEVKDLETGRQEPVLREEIAGD